MRQFVLLLSFFISVNCFYQTNLTKEQINRLADAGKIYGYVKYFHPWLQYKNINWDSAFAANVEGIIKAENKYKYATVLQSLFSVLNDGLTHVVYTTDKGINYEAKELSYQVKDSILYIQMNDAPNNTFDKLQRALVNLNKVKAAIFDMRRPINSKYVSTTPPGLVFDWSSSYFKGEVLQPSGRSVSYIGWPGIMGGDVNDRVYYKQSMSIKMRGTASNKVPIVFIAENEEQLPVLATELQQKESAAIIQKEGTHLLQGKAITFYIYDSVLIKMRTTEGINSDGSLAEIYPNATYSSEEDFSVAITKAEQLITNGFSNQAITKQIPPPGVCKIADYTNDKYYPSLGYRMLAAAKIFSVIDNFYAHKKTMKKDWEKCYSNMIAEFIEAKDSLQYMRAVAELYANIEDGHGFIGNANEPFGYKLNPIIQGRGNFIPPVFTGVIENKVVVTGIYDENVSKSIGIGQGDIILSIDGMDPMKMIEDARRYQNASNKAAQTFLICNFLLFGNEKQILHLKVMDISGKIKEVSMPSLRKFYGYMSDSYAFRFYARHTKPTFNFITRDIGYADWTSPMQQKDVDSMLSMFKNTKAIIFDMRGYPRSYIGLKNFARSPDVILAKFSVPSPSSPNIKGIGNEILQHEDNHVSYQSINFNKNEWVYPGKVVMLINEIPLSAAEHICLHLKALCNATFIGSPTAGANSVQTDFNIPGNIKLYFSGGSVMYPDGKPMQRVGLQPDVYVRPTIKGFQAGKDEVLERAIKYLQTGK
jgi:hypothetical protein